MSQKSFEDTVLSGVEAIRANQKEFADDITRLKASQNDLTEKLTAVRRFQAQERRVASGVAAHSLAAIPEEIRKGINAKFRQLMKAPYSLADSKAYDEMVSRAFGEDTSPGSTLISDALLPEIYDTLAAFGKWSTLGVRRLGAKITKLPISTVRPKAQWILTEGGEIDDDENKAGDSEDLEVEALGVLLHTSFALLEDSGFDIANTVMAEFMEALSERLDHSAFAAAGVSDGDEGGFTGLFNFGTTAGAGAGNTTVESLDLEDFTRCLTTVAPIVLSRRAKWWMHPTVLARALSVRDENGRPIFQNAMEAPAFGGIGSILGYQVELVHAAPSANTSSSKVMTFGDPDGFVVGIRSDFRFNSSDHFRLNRLQRSFLGWGRAGVQGRRENAFAVLTLAAS